MTQSMITNPTAKITKAETNNNQWLQASDKRWIFTRFCLPIFNLPNDESFLNCPINKANSDNFLKQSHF
jgi:hypothetical protein